jgi:hypothetical protein
VNPLQFVLENIVGNNMIVARFRLASFGEDAPGMVALRVLRDVLPPQTALVVIIEVRADDEYYDLSENCDETLTTHIGTPLMSDTYALETSSSEKVKIYHALGSCA